MTICQHKFYKKTIEEIKEVIGENTLVYYFKVVEPEYFYVYGVREYYVKAVYKFQSTGIPPYKSWQFDVVWTSSYEEIQTILEVNLC